MIAVLPYKSPKPTAVGALSSAFAVHGVVSGVAEFWR
jgi:hypothetical protein